MLMTFSVLGLIGGILCAVGDILFDLKGKGNQKTGPGGNVDTNWIRIFPELLCRVWDLRCLDL